MFFASGARRSFSASSGVLGCAATPTTVGRTALTWKLSEFTAIAGESGKNNKASAYKVDGPCLCQVGLKTLRRPRNSSLNACLLNASDIVLDAFKRHVKNL
jgi:hypothetical protein